MDCWRNRLSSDEPRRCCGKAECQFGWLRGTRNLLGQNSFWLRRPDTYRIHNYWRYRSAANWSIVLRKPCFQSPRNEGARNTVNNERYHELDSNPRVLAVIARGVLID